MHARYLTDLGRHLRDVQKHDEAANCYRQALAILERIDDSYDRGRALVAFAQSQDGEAPQEADALFRRAVAEYHKYLARENTIACCRRQIAGHFRAIGQYFADRFPLEAEKLFEESVSLGRNAGCGFTNQRRDWHWANLDRLAYIRFLRRSADAPVIDRISDTASARIARAESLYQEVLETQRMMVKQYAHEQDRLELVKYLEAQARYLLKHSNQDQAPGFPVAAALPADALLTEAIQLCRTLTAEFPENVNYKDRLAALLKLRAERFGQPPVNDKDNSNVPPKPKGG
jgi:tetratricopeptide (TPR) repeat protein